MGTFRVGTRPSEFVLAFFGKASAERVVGIFPDFGIAGWLFDFGADKLVFEIVLVILVFAIGKLAKEPMFQTASKNGLRSSEKRKPRARVPYTPYIGIEGFVQATACFECAGCF